MAKNTSDLNMTQGPPVETPISSLKEHPQNPNRGDDKAIEQSIRTNGFFGALIVQRSTNYVLAGNHRMRAALRLGLETVPVFYVDVDDKAALRILLADNQTARQATYDQARLNALLSSFTSDELLGTGFTPKDAQVIQEDIDGGVMSLREFSTGWGVLVTLSDEWQQVALLQELANRGLKGSAIIG